MREAQRLVITAEISPNDEMYTGDLAHYRSVGISALRCIESSLVVAGSPEPKRVLDLPCGHGRVLRALRAAFPSAEITACDLNRDGVDYCARTFDAKPVYSADDPDEIALSGAYDLIWCGSLLTHLPEARWVGFLRLFDRVLAPGGVAVFTTHGRRSAGWLRTGEQMYGLTPPLATDLLAQFEETGMGYVDYPGQHGYGISISSLPFVLELTHRVTTLRTVSCLEYGWDEHQDVVAGSRPGEPERSER